MSTTKKLLLAPVVAAIAFVALQSFAPAAQQIDCVGAGTCIITLPDGTKVESTGSARITPSPAPVDPVQDATAEASDL